MTAGQIIARPLVSWPRKARPGGRYLLTVDLNPAEDATWPYAAEEIVVHCLVRAAPLFSSAPVGTPAIVMHRFGGSYGPARFILTPRTQSGTGTLTVTLLNDQGVAMQRLELDNVEICADAPDPDAADVEVEVPLLRDGHSSSPGASADAAGTQRRPTGKRRTTERLLSDVPTRFGAAWRLIQRIPPLERAANRSLINRGINALPPPPALSTKRDIVTQDTLRDRTYNRRLLPPAADGRTSPDARDVVELFRRGAFIESEKSTVLFAYVAQWFAEGLLRSDRGSGGDTRDIRRSESSHEVDLAQLYGLDEATTDALRDRRHPMLLACQGEIGEELPPDLYEADGSRAGQFAAVRTIGTSQAHVDNAQLLAMGDDAANTQIGYSMLNTLFLREHNRIARVIAETQPSWDEDRIFYAARSILTVLFIKILIEEYLNHIHPYHFKFRLDPRAFDDQRWVRSNWNTVESNLFYRWHSLIPSELRIGSAILPLEQTIFRSKEVLQRHGLAALFESASQQPAGRVCLRNTAAVLQTTELRSIEAARTARVRSYNDYREACQFRRAHTFEDISSDPEICHALRRVYGDVDEVEYYVGIFAEDIRANAVLPPLIGRLAGQHAFSQLLSNPLLDPSVYNETTFSARGMHIIAETRSLDDIVHRNTSRTAPVGRVTLTRANWKRE